ncbi:MAG TPA: aminoglycoside 6-adenylyltransferase [Ktedonobacterales bacterium]|nr:aminoglycoside 6-adenylyltransferase [Ktedonobacterales bacterium]
MDHQSFMHETLLARVVAWADRRDDIRAVLVVGSRARMDRPADQWSDMDIVLVTSEPRRYLDWADWLDELAPTWLTFLEPTAVGEGTERRALFDNAVDVDFIPFATAAMQTIAAQGWPAEIAGVIRRGMRVVLDKEGWAPRLALAANTSLTSAAEPPSAEGFANTVNDFWFHTVWTAKKLRRGELWTAIDCLTGYMLWRVLHMIEWHTQVTRGADVDTWHNGRFVEQWADPRVVAGLRQCFPRYDAADIARGLLATMDLYRWLTRETAGALGYDYPAWADERATDWVRSCLNDLRETPTPRSASADRR